MSTYSCYESVPPISVRHRYRNIRTLADLRRRQTYMGRIEAYSPTACYFEYGPDQVTGAFYHDSQGCVTWVLGVDGRVSVRGEVVAESLPLFLSRIHRENCLWHRAQNRSMKPLRRADREYLVGMQE